MYHGPFGLLTNRCIETPGDHNPDKLHSKKVIISFLWPYCVSSLWVLNIYVKTFKNYEDIHLLYIFIMFTMCHRIIQHPLSKVLVPPLVAALVREPGSRTEQALTISPFFSGEIWSTNLLVYYFLLEFTHHFLYILAPILPSAHSLSPTLSSPLHSSQSICIHEVAKIIRKINIGHKVVRCSLRYKL